MTKLVNYEGKYKRQGLKLDKDNVQFIIGQRKKLTKKKSEKYLLILEDNKRSYFSSLYPASIPDNYFAEYKGVRYEVIMNDKSVIFKNLSYD